MATKTKEVGIRLSVQDKDAVERAFQDVGREGNAALRRIELAAKPASSALMTVSAAASLGKSAFLGWGTGIFTAVTSALSLSAAIAGISDALDQMGDISDRSKATGLDPEFLQELTYQAGLAGVEYDQLGASLETFVKSAGQAEVGKGKMVAALKALNPELLTNIQLAQTQEERLRLAADAIDKAGSASEKAALSVALFGQNGTKMVQVFEGGADAMDRMAQEARALGIVIDRDVIANAEEMGDKLEVAQKIIDVNLKTALVNIAPWLIWFAQLMATASGSIRRMTDAVKDLPDQSSASLDERMVELGKEQIGIENELIRLRGLKDQQGQLNGAIVEADIAAQLRRRAEIEAEEQRILAIDADRKPDEPVVPDDPIDIPPTPPSAAAKKAVQDAARLIDSLRTASEDYATTLAKLDQMQSAGLITQETHNRGVAEAALKLADAAKLTGDYTDAQAALDQALGRGIITETQYTDAVEAMTKRRLDASNDWVDGVRLGLLDVAEHSDKIASKIGDAVSGAFDDAADALTEFVRGGKLDFSDLVDSITKDLIKLSIQQGITGPLAKGLTSFVGGLLGGGAGSALGNDIGSGAGSFSGLSAFAGTGHGGATIGGAATGRRVPLEMFAGTSRHHTGTPFLKAGEVPFIGMRGEEIGWPDQLKRKYGNSSPAQVVVQQRTEIHNYSSEPVREEKTKGADGVDVNRIIIGAVNSAMAEGRFDQVLGTNFGVKRKGF